MAQEQIGIWLLCAQFGQALSYEHCKDPGEAGISFVFHSLIRLYGALKLWWVVNRFGFKFRHCHLSHADNLSKLPHFSELYFPHLIELLWRLNEKMNEKHITQCLTHRESWPPGHSKILLTVGDYFILTWLLLSAEPPWLSEFKCHYLQEVFLQCPSYVSPRHFGYTFTQAHFMPC